MRTAHCWEVLSIRAVSAPLPPEIDRYQPREGERRRRRRGRRKTWNRAALPPRYPSPTRFVAR
ncbi:hypothetical protein B296_00054529, partial [Ensete ventricosum]